MKGASFLGSTLLAATFAFACSTESASFGDPAKTEGGSQYRLDYQQWRVERVDQLMAPDGWLSLAGLHWLQPGNNLFVTGAENDIVLSPLASLQDQPETLGNFVLDDSSASARRILAELEPGSAMTVVEIGDGEVGAADKTRRTVRLATQREGTPTILGLGSLTFVALERGGEMAIRVRDLEATSRGSRIEIPAFELDPGWRLQARFERADEKRSLPIPNVTGRTYEQASIGTVVFEVEGREHRLDAIGDSVEEPLLLVVGDQTNGSETYGGGRYIYVTVGEDDAIDLDLNRLYNPPCVFTPYATCPLPPPQNRLALRIEAGEQTYQKPG